MSGSQSARPSFAVVGLGRAGFFHLTSLSQLSNTISLKYVVDIDKQVADDAAKKYGAKAAYDIDEVLQDKELTAVVISSSTHAHFAQIMKSLEAGKAVFTEKPISFDVKELEKAIQTAIESKIPFFVGFQRRLDENFRVMRDAVQQGRIGKVRMIRTSSRDNPEPPMAYLKISGGIFHDMLCHDFDMLHFITGEIPESVYSVAHTYNPEIAAMDDVDTVIVSLTYSSGLIATADTSRISAYGYDQRVEVFGEKGMVQAENEKNHTVTIATEEGYLTAPAKHSFPQRYLKAYRDEMSHFVQMVETWTPEPVESLKRHVLLERVATGAELSWKLKRVVRIDEVDALREKEG
eukprot:CAMPEP_0201477090 /NCGR_PEP_ID=MMETSP0151_2-20130828/2199_1 /ASSEMBLY_ACC=CAM_ASM_000257 /TAXON_ID=200890 /ORGANISM="Paramoeba atlantica, Strain 621/1 / CCAP 1560/9" /LENGTH=348 /DNA_ID=CAMNT_0047857707 /DNA_START=49 /DNA_END=1095 /DNA_ORIENTATION=+